MKNNIPKKAGDGFPRSSGTGRYDSMPVWLQPWESDLFCRKGIDDL